MKLWVMCRMHPGYMQLYTVHTIKTLQLTLTTTTCGIYLKKQHERLEMTELAVGVIAQSASALCCYRYRFTRLPGVLFKLQ